MNELRGFKSAHLKDGLALLKLFLWFEKNISSKLINFKAFILISKTILNRKNLKLKKIISLANKNNIKLIEVAFEKSNLSEEQSQSDAIIHGFNNGTIEVIKKVIDSLK